MTALASSLPILEHVQFTDGGRRRLDEVSAFLDELDGHEHPLAAKARSEFEERLLYLEGFGGSVSDTDARRWFQVTLGWDMAPLSFTVTWCRLDLNTGEYAYSMNGALIWHGGPADPFAVCLDPTLLWAIHT